MCDADRDDWASLDDLGPDEELWHEFSLEQYNAACARCEHYVTVTSGVVNRLRGALAFEAGKRRRGRILQEPVRVGGVQLEAGDRLEPSAAMILTCQLIRRIRLSQCVFGGHPPRPVLAIATHYSTRRLTFDQVWYAWTGFTVCRWAYSRCGFLS